MSRVQECPCADSSGSAASGRGNRAGIGAGPPEPGPKTGLPPRVCNWGTQRKDGGFASEERHQDPVHHQDPPHQGGEVRGGELRGLHISLQGFVAPLDLTAPGLGRPILCLLQIPPPDSVSQVCPTSQDPRASVTPPFTCLETLPKGPPTPKPSPPHHARHLVMPPVVSAASASAGDCGSVFRPPQGLRALPEGR